jgi:hypothetical protein
MSFAREVFLRKFNSIALHLSFSLRGLEMSLDDINAMLQLAAQIEQQKYEDELEELELQKQYEFMQYAEDAALADAQFYGEYK